MISTTEIGKMITLPGQFHPEYIADLKALSEKYPYSQVFSILLLKGLKLNNDIRFEEELIRNSFRISDRTQLFDLINSSLPEVVSEAISDVSESVPEQEVTFEDKDSLPMNVAGEETFIEKTLSDEETVEYTIEEEETRTEDTDVAEAETESESMEEVTEPQDTLEESILHYSFAQNYRLDELTEEEEKALEEKQLSRQDEKPTTKTAVSEPESKSRSVSFTSWLHADTNYSEEDQTDKKAIQAVVEGFSEFNPMEDLFGEVKKSKAEFFSPSKKAKESLNEQRLPVSETLARIYALQGNFPKAIEAYEQLSLKYPEKKIFFANLIKDLKKQINS